ASDGIGDHHKHDRGRRGCLSQRRGRRRALRQDHIRRDACEFRRLLPQTARVAGGPAVLDPDVATIPPTKVRERLRKRGNQGLLIGITLISSHQHADAPHLIRLLRACRKWPSSGRAAEQRDELAPPHSITSSASICMEYGTTSPSALAVFILMTNSNFVGCCTGKSAGLSPWRMRPT